MTEVADYGLSDCLQLDEGPTVEAEICMKVCVHLLIITVVPIIIESRWNTTKIKRDSITTF